MNHWLRPTDHVRAEAPEKILLRLGGSRTVYYLGSSYVGELPLKQAVAYADQCDICVIYCGNGVGYFQGRACDFAQPRYLLIAGK